MALFAVCLGSLFMLPACVLSNPEIKTASLAHISSLKIISPELIEITHDGLGPTMLLREGRMEDVHRHHASATIRKGETFTISDRRHARVDYQLLRIQGDQVIIKEESIFDARSFGDDVIHETKLIAVRAYGSETLANP